MEEINYSKFVVPKNEKPNYEGVFRKYKKTLKGLQRRNDINRIINTDLINVLKLVEPQLPNGLVKDLVRDKIRDSKFRIC